MTRIRSAIGAILRRWGNSLDPDGAFQDEVAADVRRRLASDPLGGRTHAGFVTFVGGGGGGSPARGHDGSATVTGPGWEITEVDIDSSWSTGTPNPQDGTGAQVHQETLPDGTRIVTVKGGRGGQPGQGPSGKGGDGGPGIHGTPSPDRG